MSRRSAPCDCYHGGRCTPSSLCAVQAVESERDDITDGITDFMVYLRVTDSIEDIRAYAEELWHAYDTYDPTPYCTIHGPKSACTCGPIARNE